ncbi:MAG: CDP-alcohol phosphatidyltransferase family protein, partial [Bauldia litoralis]
GAMVTVFALTEFAGALGLAAGGGRRYDGPFGKSDRAVYFSVLAVIVALVAVPQWLAVAALWLALFLGLLTVFTRIRAAITGGETDG